MQESLPFVLFETPAGDRVRVFPGGIVGRMSTAALRLDDPWVSEAHALVSLRGRHLQLLALRGPLSLGRVGRSSVTLEPGMKVFLTDELALEVIELSLPKRIAALLGLEEEPYELTHPELSVFVTPLRVQARLQPDAAGWLWTSSGAWWWRAAGEAPQELSPGVPFDVHGHALTLAWVAEPQVGVVETRAQGQSPPMTLRLTPELATLRVEGRRESALRGNAARILFELATVAATGDYLRWEVVAERIWPAQAANPDLLRKNWDTNMQRLRRRLHGARVPAGLIESPENSGHVRLRLREVDTLQLEG